MRIESAASLVALGVALLWSPPSLGAFIYKADAIEGWVVDAGTGKPLEGVVVVAHWQLRGGLEGGTPIRELKILESVTDQNGRYSFPAWGPEFASVGSLESESPEILMFKQGYKYLAVDNDWHPDMDTSKSDWNKKTVKLEPFSGTLAQYAEALASLSSTLWIVGYDVGYRFGDYCGWRSFPRMLRALDRLEAEVRAARVAQATVVSSLKSNSQRLMSRGCGSL